MSVLAQGDSEPLNGFDALVEYFERGCKPKEQWWIGTEHEKFGFFEKDFSPVPYEGEGGIQTLLNRLQQFGWNPHYEGDNIIGLEQKLPNGKNGANISLEPGGQLELSGAMLRTLHQTCDEVNSHLEQVRAIAQTLGIGFLGLGFCPHWALKDVPRMPKGRYRIIEKYMEKIQSQGRDMMFRTCTVQVNLDFSSETDMIKKLRVALALQPIATAIFANSPFADGKPTGYQSYRSQLWLHTDEQRTGMLDQAFAPDFGFAKYAEYALDVPLYFVHRDSQYIDVAGKSFRDFLEGKLPGLEGERPNEADWANHLTTIFPEARLKRFLEMRGADSGPWRQLCALPAFWVGLLYDDNALDAAWQMVREWSASDRNQMRQQVPKDGLSTLLRGEPLVKWARKFVELSRNGLKARANFDSNGNDETHFLHPVEETLAREQNLAQELLECYHGKWNGNVTNIFTQYAY
ncbi:MAG: glutamate--cysteine ligase [Hyphomicrobiales bacterium]|nr:glutamate--cysteine ligase [Hyphomicrobiales bacterium]